ncbi:DUF916 domain-containing protein [Candidatus Saccharibacteria bacterium]|nr:DUF916 domain-containing protein [Candidatus Saccharibacteria bacterium]
MLRIKKLLIGLFLVVFSLSPMAFAQDSGSTNIANGMQISPTRTEMSLLPGEQKEFSISVKNVADVPLKLESTVNDFESDGITGTPQIVVDENRQVSTSLKNYVKGLGEVDLEAGESKDVTLTVDMPDNVPPGAYYGAVRFTIIQDGNSTSGDGTQVSLNASVASLLFVEVSGDITQQIQIESMNICGIEVRETQNIDPNTSPQGTGIQENCDKTSSFFFSPPNVASIKIANKGNGFSRPFGRVSLSRGSTEIYSYELNNSEPRGTVLPDSTRVFSNKIEGANKIGRYTLLASISHGDGGEVIIQKATFWYIPPWAIVVIVAIILALIALMFVIYKKLGKKRKGKK